MSKGFSSKFSNHLLPIWQLGGILKFLIGQEITLNIGTSEMALNKVGQSGLGHKYGLIIFS
jgi:hypothetical protein